MKVVYFNFGRTGLPVTDDYANPNEGPPSSSTSASTPTPGSIILVTPIPSFAFLIQNRIQLPCQYERKSIDSCLCSCLTSRQPPFPNCGFQLNQPTTSSGRLIADRSTGKPFTGRSDCFYFHLTFASLFQPCPSQRAQMPRSQAAVSSSCCWVRPQ
jgi:hypothetical protein